VVYGLVYFGSKSCSLTRCTYNATKGKHRQLHKLRCFLPFNHPHPINPLHLPAHVSWSTYPSTSPRSNLAPGPCPSAFIPKRSSYPCPQLCLEMARYMQPFEDTGAVAGWIAHRTATILGLICLLKLRAIDTNSRALLRCTLSPSFLPSSFVLTSDIFQCFWRNVHFNGTSRVRIKSWVFMCAYFRTPHDLATGAYSYRPIFSIFQLPSFPHIPPSLIPTFPPGSPKFSPTGVNFTPNLNTNVIARRYEAVTRPQFASASYVIIKPEPEPESESQFSAPLSSASHTTSVFVS